MHERTIWIERGGGIYSKFEHTISIKHEEWAIHCNFGFGISMSHQSTQHIRCNRSNEYCVNNTKESNRMVNCVMRAIEWCYLIGAYQHVSVIRKIVWKKATHDNEANRRAY